MPCSCKIPGPAYPENREWGPFIWSVLHGLAEKAGKVVFALYESDERRAWIQLLKAIGPMLPCSDCRDHYKVWITAHPVQTIETMPYASIKEWIRLWLWELHQDVNRRLDKAILPHTELSAQYSNINITMQFKLFELIEKRAIQQQGVPIQAWMTFVKHFRTLASVYGMT